DHYKRLQEALRRLASTYVETNIRVPKGSRKKVAGFHWIEHWDAYEDDQGRPIGMSVTLPDWLYDGIVQGGGVLSIHEDYFLLTVDDPRFEIPRHHRRRHAGGITQKAMRFHSAA